MHRPTSTTALLGTLGVAAGAVHVVGWLVAGLVQDGYDPARQDIGELAARHATAPWLYGAAALVAGALTIALAVGLWRTLAPTWRAGLGVGVLGLYGLGTALVGVLPLDCWSTDLACRAGYVGVDHRWTDVAHGVADTVAVLALVVVPYALSRPFGDDEGWRPWSTPCVGLGTGFIVALVVYGALPERDGLVLRVIFLVAAAFVAALGLRVRQLADRPRPTPPPTAPRLGRRSLWPGRQPGF